MKYRELPANIQRILYACDTWQSRFEESRLSTQDHLSLMDNPNESKFSLGKKNDSFAFLFMKVFQVMTHLNILLFVFVLFLPHQNILFDKKTWVIHFR